MKLIIEGTKEEIEVISQMRLDECRLPCACSDCVFWSEDTDCRLTCDILQFLKDCADFEVISTFVDTVKDDKKRDCQITLTDSQKEIGEVVDGIKETLLTKNARYGNSILSPLRIFSKKETTETDIPARLDDKLSRIKNSQQLRVNDIADLIGYLVLLLVQMGVKKQDLLDLID